MLDELQPAAAVFLGDTNTTTGALAAAQLNIPVVHIEGCMRSYDWRMPEEKYRTTIDHLADVIYTYFDEYKEQGVREGLNPANIVVVGNPIVDILNHYYYSRKDKFDAMATPEFFAVARPRARQVLPDDLPPARERPHPGSLRRDPRPRRAGAVSRLLSGELPDAEGDEGDSGSTVPKTTCVVDPIGYDEMLCLMVNSRGVITDSGTVVEETCVLQVPSLQMRKSTERPQVYDVGSSVKFDPAEARSIRRATCSASSNRCSDGRGRTRSGDGQVVRADRRGSAPAGRRERLRPAQAGALSRAD